MADPRHADETPRVPGPHDRPRRPSRCRWSRPSTAWPSASAPPCCRGATSCSCRREARFRVPFVSLGVTTEAGSSATLPAVMGPQAAARFVLTGEWLVGRRAPLATGLVVAGRARRRAASTTAQALAAPARRPAARRRCAPPPGCCAPGAPRRGWRPSSGSTSSSPGSPAAPRTSPPSRRSSRAELGRRQGGRSEPEGELADDHGACRRRRRRRWRRGGPRPAPAASTGA